MNRIVVTGVCIEISKITLKSNLPIEIEKTITAIDYKLFCP